MEDNVIPIKKSKTQKVKEHVKRQKWAYVWAGVASAMTALALSQPKEFYRFLESKGIDPMEYYCPEMLEELRAKAVTQ